MQDKTWYSILGLDAEPLFLQDHMLSVNFPNPEPNGQGYYLVPIDQLQLIETAQLMVS